MRNLRTAGAVTVLADSGTMPRTLVSARPAERARRHAVSILRVCAFTLMVFPSDTVLKAVGYGSLSALVAMFAFVAYMVSMLLGLHNPLDRRHPTRAGIEALWIVSLVSYALMGLTEHTGTQFLSAERWFEQLAVITGIALVTAEWLTTLEDVKKVLRALVWGGAFNGAVAGLQFKLRLDVTPYLRMIPGFTRNGVNLAITSRGALNRVAGTGLSPIELGVVTGMLLPIAVYMALYDKKTATWKRLLPVGLMAFAVPASVSRAAVVSVAVAFTLFVVMLPDTKRVLLLAVTPVALAAVFVAAPGVIGTISHFFTSSANDPSILHRTSNFAFVQESVRQAPWFGTGPGTFAPNTSTYAQGLHILDDQYLSTAINLGLVGMVALGYYFLLPFLTALTARRRSEDPDLRALCGALAAAAAAAALCSLTFDSFSFPQFSGSAAFVVGLAGACWLLVTTSRRERAV